MSSVNQKIRYVSSLDQSTLSDWEKTAIKEAAEAVDTLSWSEIDAVNDIYWRHQNA